MASKHRVTINLANDEYKDLTALSRKNRVSLAWLGRQAIIEFLNHYAGEERQLPLNLPSQPRRANG